MTGGSVPPDAGFSFACEPTVRWSDLDAAGVLNNAVYLTLCEEARRSFFAHLDLMRGDQFPFLLGETKVRYLAPVLETTRLRVSARVTRLGSKSFDMEQVVVWRDQPVARVWATLVWVDESLRSVVLPDEARQRLRALEAEAGNQL